ncbi:MAG: ribosome silencing factor [Spirochaetia bacterium]|nr:ribosome silencing factor [Spirochaetia bacterium]
MSKKVPARETSPVEQLSNDLVRLLQEKKAKQITVLNLSRVNPYFEYFVIASATSRIQMKTLAKEIQKTFPKALHRKHSSLGAPDLESGWLVLDFFDIVVHIFLDEQRKFYNLERLWGDAQIIEYPDEA